MGGLFTLLGGLFAITSFVCYIIILIDAFNNELWKRLVSLFCCHLYTVYYAIFEFQHEHKWLIVLVWLLAGGFGGALMSAGGVHFKFPKP